MIARDELILSRIFDKIEVPINHWEIRMDNYRNKEGGSRRGNGNATILVGRSRGREGWDWTKYWSSGSRRGNFPNVERLESFLEDESSKSGIIIIAAKGSSEKTYTLVEKWNRMYG